MDRLGRRYGRLPSELERLSAYDLAYNFVAMEEGERAEAEVEDAWRGAPIQPVYVVGGNRG